MLLVIYKRLFLLSGGNQPEADRHLTPFELFLNIIISYKNIVFHRKKKTLNPTGFIRSHHPSLKPAHETLRSLRSRNGWNPVGV